MTVLDVPDRLHIEPLADQLYDRIGHTPRSPYAERFWTPVIGPTAYLLTRRLADIIDLNPDGVTTTQAMLGNLLGVAAPAIGRTINRLCLFDCAHLVGDRLQVRRHLAPLAQRHVLRLSPQLQAAHAEWRGQPVPQAVAS